MTIFRTFRTFSAPFDRRCGTAPIRTAAPLPMGVRGCGAEGCAGEIQKPPHRTFPHLGCGAEQQENRQ